MFPDPGKDARATTGPGSDLNDNVLHQSIVLLFSKLVIRLVSQCPSSGRERETRSSIDETSRMFTGCCGMTGAVTVSVDPVSYTHLRANATPEPLV